MKNKLLALIATMTACLSMFAGTNMCIKKQNGDILKFNVDDIYEVYYEAFINGGDTTIVPPFIDSVVVDASSLPLEFEIMSDSEVRVARYDYRYFYDEAGNYVEKEIEIPAKVKLDGKIYNVTSIREYAFRYCSSLGSITIPESVTSIGYDAFSYCSSLESITIPSSVKEIGESTFINCTNLTKVNIPENVRKIGDNAFANCKNLTNITVPSRVDSIGEGAFIGCRNLDIVIDNFQDSVFVGNGAFYNCKSVTYTKKSSTSKDPSTDLTRMPLSFTILSDSTVEVKGTIWDPDSILHFQTLDSLVIPERVQINGKSYSVTSIGDYAFGDCRVLKSVEIPSSVTSIGERAFKYCNIKSITIPDGVTSIGEWAFSGCFSLTSITIPESVTSIGNDAFAWCDSLTSVTIPESVTSIGDRAFYGCGSLESITIPDGVTSIGNDAFCYCWRLTRIKIPESVKSIGSSAFSGCDNLEPGLLIYDNGTKCYGWLGAKDSCVNVVIPSSVTSIESYAFTDCRSLTSITIPESVKSIGYYAFENCKKLDIVIYNSIENIKFYRREYDYATGDYNNQETTMEDSYAFYNVKSVTWKKDDPSIVNASNTILDFRVLSDSTAEVVRDWTSDKYSTLDSVNIPSKVRIDGKIYDVTSIGAWAFDRCDSLASITIPESVTSIGDSAFAGCNSLKPDLLIYANGTKCYGWVGSKDSCVNVVIPDGVKEIGEDAFIGCKNLINIEMPSSVTNIGIEAFSRTGLKSIVIPGSVSSIEQIFSGCSSLASVTISDGVTSIGERAFYYCSGLTSITIPESVTSIGWEAFEECSSLTSITIPESVTSIGWNAFYNCENLDVVIENSEENVKVGSEAFYGVKSVTYTK